jgi:hypothetical protein
MSRYTVVSAPAVESELATIWLADTHRGQVSQPRTQQITYLRSIPYVIPST